MNLPSLVYEDSPIPCIMIVMWVTIDGSMPKVDEKVCKVA